MRRGPFHLLYLLFCGAATKLIFRRARLIRLPIFLTRRGGMDVGAGFTTGVANRLELQTEEARLEIGREVQFNDYVHVAVAGRVQIGDRVLLASRVFITDHDHGNYGSGPEASRPEEPPFARKLSVKPVVIEDDVWLGEGVSVLPGVRIGRGTVVGAHAVVTRDLPPGTVCVGAPARVLKRWDAESRSWKAE